jgi:hypothetical protein
MDPGRVIAVMAVLAAVPVWAPGAQAEAPTAGKAAAIAAENRRYVDELMKRIAGKEDRPAGEVFKNVTLMMDVPAGRLIQAMDQGFSRSLGVGCNECHTVSAWESDEKEHKRVARAMMTMVGTVNETLAKVPEFADKDPKPSASCMMCHRGQLDPNPKPTAP